MCNLQWNQPNKKIYRTKLHWVHAVTRVSLGDREHFWSFCGQQIIYLLFSATGACFVYNWNWSTQHGVRFGPKHLFCISLRLKFELHVKFIWCTFYYAMTDNLFIFCIIIYLFVSWKNMFHSAYSVQKKTAVIAIIPQQLQIEISHLNGEWKCFHCIVKQQA